MTIDPRRALDVTTSLAASASRLGAGMAVSGAGTRPVEPLSLYDFEACPFCRKVREALSILDLDAVVYPCPKAGPRFRDEVRRRGGNALFPYLVDPNTGRAMYESDDIVRYLFATYGDGSVPWSLSLGPLTLATSGLASAWRFGRGERYRPRASRSHARAVGFEASPFCRIARELCTLELPYVLHNVAKGAPSARRSPRARKDEWCRTSSIRTPARRCSSRRTSCATSTPRTPSELRRA